MPAPQPTVPPRRGDGFATRLPAILAHVPWYAFERNRRLADDAGVTPATASRLVLGRIVPSFRLAEAVAAAVSRRAGRRIEAREVFTFDGTYPTGSTCALMGCPGCLPECAYSAGGRLKPKWREAVPGAWCRYPESPAPRPSDVRGRAAAPHDHP